MYTRWVSKDVYLEQYSRNHVGWRRGERGLIRRKGVSLEGRCARCCRPLLTEKQTAFSDSKANSLFVWLWLIVNDSKFSIRTIFFSHTNQPAVLLHELATKRTSQPNRLLCPYHQSRRTQRHATPSIPKRKTDAPFVAKCKYVFVVKYSCVGTCPF